MRNVRGGGREGVCGGCIWKCQCDGGREEKKWRKKDWKKNGQKKNKNIKKIIIKKGGKK